MSHRRTASLAAAGLLLLGTLASAAPVAARSHVVVLLHGLSSPKGLDTGGKSIFIGQGWAGAPGPVLAVQPDRSSPPDRASRSPTR